MRPYDLAPTIPGPAFASYCSLAFGSRPGLAWIDLFGLFVFLEAHWLTVHSPLAWRFDLRYPFAFLVTVPVFHRFAAGP